MRWHIPCQRTGLMQIEGGGWRLHWGGGLLTGGGLRRVLTEGSVPPTCGLGGRREDLGGLTRSSRRAVAEACLSVPPRAGVSGSDSTGGWADERERADCNSKGAGTDRVVGRGRRSVDRCFHVLDVGGWVRRGRRGKGEGDLSAPPRSSSPSTGGPRVRQSNTRDMESRDDARQKGDVVGS